MKLNKIVCLAVLCSVGSRMAAQETYPFRNPQLSVEQRADAGYSFKTGRKYIENDWKYTYNR